MKTETYEVRIIQAPQVVIAGPTGLTVRCGTRAEADYEFAKWAALPAGRVIAVELVRITTEVVARWPE